MDTTSLIWGGIALCLLQSALFSGLILGMFGIGRLQLEAEAETGSSQAAKILALRQDSNFLLTTLIWGNVCVNTLLALLSSSILSGISAFLFSAIGITLLGEIVPQAYFSRNAMVVGALLSPIVKCYQFLLYPLAKPTALLLDTWLGKEGIEYLKEKNLRVILQKHIQSETSDVGKLEGLGALNFLTLDDLSILDEGEVIDPKSIIEIHFEQGAPVFPNIQRNYNDEFIKKVRQSNKKWVFLVDYDFNLQLVMDSDAFLREALCLDQDFEPTRYCHKPIIVSNPQMTLGEVMLNFKVMPEHHEDDVIDHDLIVFWRKETRRVITGADLFGRLLRGVIRNNSSWCG